ncbi:cytochrome c biogenesis protein ResB [Microbacterium sp. ASV49]|uniref:Cytochrome c biogenesis protein ResB n=1 Tax=Microbacterium candidum TaxID=3041922 RepID=A0ABT7N4H3_9MICO|nr:cytochrome c biogenesis protein ResB [Microbacterium sp. ASV49]MDL9981614.1 cytochrome c biogenesis protein ResB [Microbacterium sp. ASV49]
MSRSRSDDRATSAATDPLRPADAVDGVETDDSVTSPKLGFVGWMRWGWRQLTSMRTALVLLLLLAIAAVPGSIVPQRSADPNGVVQWKQNNPSLFPILDKMQMFDVYTSAWFSAIYILLFISLIGCVIPRTKHHWQALRARPPRTPARLSRLSDHVESSTTLAPEADGAIAAEHAIDVAQQQLRRAGYRVERYDGKGVFSVSAERGYLRETGNLVFHASLVGVLLAVGIGGGLTYTGQRVVVEGQTFVDALTDYDSFDPGRFVNSDTLTPFTLSLDKFDVTYQPYGTAGSGQAGDFVAHVTTQLDGGTRQAQQIEVNHPLSIVGDRIYLLGNGYAPTVTVRNADGDVVFHDSVPFLPQDANMTSLGVIKVPDGLPEQLGLVGFFYPTSVKMSTGAFTSAYPSLVNPILTLNVYAGDLGINNGTPRSVYALDQTGMTQLTGGKTGVDSIELQPGQTANLPKGMGTITFDDASPSGSTDGSQSVKRFVSLSIHHDAAGPWVLVFAIFALAGLITALFVPRRRMWVKASTSGQTLKLEYAGLARGEDPTLKAAVEAVAEKHAEALQAPETASAPSESAEPRK